MMLGLQGFRPSGSGCQLIVGNGGGSESTTTDRKSTRLNSSHLVFSYAVFCLKKKLFYRDQLCRYSSLHLPCSVPEHCLTAQYLACFRLFVFSLIGGNALFSCAQFISNSINSG